MSTQLSISFSTL